MFSSLAVYTLVRLSDMPFDQNDGKICELACSTLFLILPNGVRKRMIPHTEFFKGVSANISKYMLVGGDIFMLQWTFFCMLLT